MIDTFYVTDLTGQKIENPARIDAIRKRLIATLEGAAPQRRQDARRGAPNEGRRAMPHAVAPRLPGARRSAA